MALVRKRIRNGFSLGFSKSWWWNAEVIQCGFKEWVWPYAELVSPCCYSSRKAEHGPGAHHYISCTWMLMCLPTQCLKNFCPWQRSDYPPGVEEKLWLQNELKSFWRPWWFKYEMPNNQLSSVWCTLLQQELSTSESFEFKIPFGYALHLVRAFYLYNHPLQSCWP